MSVIARKNIVFVDGAHSKNTVEILPQQKKISIYEVTNMPMIIGEFSMR